MTELWNTPAAHSVTLKSPSVCAGTLLGFRVPCVVSQLPDMASNECVDVLAAVAVSRGADFLARPATLVMRLPSDACHAVRPQINWAMNDKDEFVDIVETVYRGARKGRGLVVSPKGACCINRDQMSFSARQIGINCTQLEACAAGPKGGWGCKAQGGVASLEVLACVAAFLLACLWG
jgi:Mitosis protein DIM1